MTRSSDGGAAFPFAATDPSNVQRQTNGMSLRDWLAGQALAGMLANPEIDGDVDSYARWALEHADTLLRERSRQQEDAAEPDRIAREIEGGEG